MSIWGVLSSHIAKMDIQSTQKVATNSSSYKGPGFMRNMSDVMRAVNIEVAKESIAAALGLNREERELEEAFNFEEAEEEMAQEYLARIKELQEEFKDEK